MLTPLTRLALLLASIFPAVAQDRGLAKWYLQTRQAAGCYELRVLGWTPAELKQNDVLPMRFELTLSLDPLRKGWLKARNLDPQVRYRMVGSSWNIDSRGVLLLDWSTGYVGYNIQLTGSAEHLRGRAHWWTDTGPLPGFNPISDWYVEASRFACKE